MRSPILALIILALTLPALPGREVHVRVLGFNLHGGADAPVSAVADFIAGLDADIVSLQEVPSGAYLDEVARRGGFPYATAIDLGKAVLCRTPIEERDAIRLVSGRGLLRISTTVAGIPLSVYGVHISWNADGDHQAQQIEDDVLPLDHNPRRILIGDFNDEHFSTQNSILESRLTDAWSDLGVRPGARTTWPATGFAGSEGHQLIDLLLYDPAGGVRPIDGEIFSTVPVLSDHRPVLFTLALTDPIRVEPPSDFEVFALDATTLEVRFDREVDAPTASEPSRYRIRREDEPIEDASAVLEVAVDRYRRRVRLRTEAHTLGASAGGVESARYSLAIQGVNARGGTAGMTTTERVYHYRRNLIADPGAEDPPGAWQFSGGMTSAARVRQLRPYRGDALFAGGLAVSRAVQHVDLGGLADEMDAGRVTAHLGAYLATGYLTFAGGESRAAPYDDAEMLTDVLDVSGDVLLRVSSGKYDTLYWYPYRHAVPLPPGSRSLRITLAGYHKADLDPINDAAFDDVHVSVEVGERHHGRLSGNLLRNGGAEDEELGPWSATGNFVRKANYLPFSGSQLVAAAGEGLFLASAGAAGESRLTQTVDLPRVSRHDYLRWSGTLRSFASRLGVRLRLELLTETGSVVLERHSREFLEAEWTRFEEVVALAERAVAARFHVETSTGTVGAALADELGLELVGGPADDPWFERGDLDRDGRYSVTDAVWILQRLFRGDVDGPVCDDAADVDDDGNLDAADAIALLRYLFLDAAPPRPPIMGEPGPDLTADALDCR